MRCTPDDQAGSRGRRTVNQNNIIFDSESFAWLTRLQWSSLSFTSHRFHFFPAFLGLSVKTEGRTNQWTNRCGKNNPAIASRSTQWTCSQQKSLKMGRVGFADHFCRLVSWKVCGLSSTPKPTLTHTLQWKAKYSYHHHLHHVGECSSKVSPWFSMLIFGATEALKHQYG